jgi:hypothetical protein
MGRVIMAGIKVLEIRITTKLPVKDVAFIFRDNIVKADKRFFRMLESQNKLQWEFRTPEKPTDAFDSLREPAGPEPAFQVVAHGGPRPRGNSAFQQAVAASNELEFFLKVWDHGTDRHVMVGTGDSQLARSYVGNFMNHLKGADPNIQVRETTNVV